MVVLIRSVAQRIVCIRRLRGSRYSSGSAAQGEKGYREIVGRMQQDSRMWKDSPRL